MFSVDALCKNFDTDVDTGLTEKWAEENLKRYGPNGIGRCLPEFTMVKKENEWKKIIARDLVPGDVLLLEGNSWICGLCMRKRMMMSMKETKVIYIWLYWTKLTIYFFINQSKIIGFKWLYEYIKLAQFMRFVKRKINHLF